MLTSLDLTNFTVFAKGSFQFSPQLNVIVGENGVGKSQLLKVPYSILATCAEEGRRGNAGPPTKVALKSKLADKLVAVMRAETLGRMARRRPGVTRCDVKCRMSQRELDLDFHFTTKSNSEVQIDELPTDWVEKSPVFLPTRELLTIFPNFVSVYDGHYLEFEESWRDTCLLLGAPAIRGPREKGVQEMLAPLEAAMGGKVELDRNGRFYLNMAKGRMEMPLVAEGFRKFAMLARLIATGSLLDKGYLFWDEPETNLNPRLVKLAAQTILGLCQKGVQAFVATHSLFLLREFDILLQSGSYESVKSRFIGLHQDDDGVRVEQGDAIDEIGSIAALDEELRQADRYLETSH